MNWCSQPNCVCVCARVPCALTLPFCIQVVLSLDATAGLVVLTGRDGGGVVGAAPAPHPPGTVRGPGLLPITVRGHQRQEDGPDHREVGVGSPLQEGNPHHPKGAGPGKLSHNSLHCVTHKTTCVCVLGAHCKLPIACNDRVHTSKNP